MNLLHSKNKYVFQSFLIQSLELKMLVPFWQKREKLIFEHRVEIIEHKKIRRIFDQIQHGFHL